MLEGFLIGSLGDLGGVKVVTLMRGTIFSHGVTRAFTMGVCTVVCTFD